ncbi:MAG: KpsF/GutQ family sugar-phosphate isomerase [Halothiobacillaceae bacterium]
MNRTNLIDLGRSVLNAESDAIRALADRIDQQFVDACNLLFGCRGRVVVTGMGKSGHVGGKIAATLASTGTPAFFVHPGEASHGDLGMVTAQDVLLVLSNSGETSELLALLPGIKRLGLSMVALTGRPDSTLARAATVHLDVGVDREACPLNLAPTTSTTAALAMGDALAVALLDARGFTPEDFARAHPGGALGRRLLLHVEDVMHQGDRIPRVPSHALLRNALMEITSKSLGMTCVVDADNRLLGIFTDGDLRRVLDRDIAVLDLPIEQVMTPDPQTCPPQMLAAEALGLMESRKINALVVVDEDRRVLGALNMHDLLHAGLD